MSTQHYSDGQDIGKGNQDAPMSNDEAARLIGQAIGQVQRVIVGQERMVEQLMVGVLAKGHILLEGVPGVAKTLAVRSFATVLGGSFARVQFTPDLVPSDIVGTRIYSASKETFDIELGPVFVNFVLADEINRAPAKVQSAMLELMAERQVSIAGQTFPAPHPFSVIATQNPVESEGVYPLPEAQRDRFLLKIDVPYPRGNEEFEILRRMSVKAPQPQQVLTPEAVVALQDMASDVFVHNLVAEYVVRLVLATRNPGDFGMSDLANVIQIGCSPRATLGLVAAARALALVHGRDYVLPTDVQAVAVDVMAHRLVLSFDAIADNVSASDVIERVVAMVPPPTPVWNEGSVRLLSTITLTIWANTLLRRPRPPSSEASVMARPTFRDPQPPSVAQTLVSPPTGATLPLNQLAPEAALRRLELTIVRRLEGLLHGDHLGLLPGTGADVSDARPYEPDQDDVRMMDWAVTARTTVPHVRETIADRELEVWALLDVTGSMNWGTVSMTKRDLGIAAIATIGFLSQRMGDRFGGVIMRPDSVRRLPARSGRTALYGLLRSMLTEPIVADNAPGQVTLAKGIENLAASGRRRGMKVVVSDFLSPGDDVLNPNDRPEWERSLRRLSVRNQVLCIEVVDAAELDFPDVGDVMVRDPETSFARYVNTADKATRERMNAASRAQRERISVAIRRAGAGHLQLRTDSDWVTDIARFVLGYRRTAAILHQPPQGVTK